MTDLSAECRKPAYARPQLVGRPERFEELFPLPRWAVLARLLLPEHLIDACNKRDMTLVYLDQLEIAFRLAEYRRRHGTYPPTLDALPGIPAMDPFSGRPYIYRRTERGALFYSVGANRVDDQGAKPPPKGETTRTDQNRYAGDLVWHMENANDGGYGGPP